MALASIWRRDKSKRERFALDRARSDRNWPYHRDRLKAVFDQLSLMDDRFSAHDKDEMHKRRQEGDPIHHGYDYVILSEGDRYTRRKSVYENGVSCHIDYEKELGGSITVHYTYEQALIQVFLKPPKSTKSIVDKADVLVWVGRDTDALTTSFCEKLIAKYLVFSRVESNFEKAGRVDRARVRWWRFMDARNRLQIYDTHVNLLNKWEVPVASALLAITSLVISIMARFQH